MTDVAAMRERALAAARAGRTQEAARLFEQAAERYPRHGMLLNSIGSFHAGLGNDEDALRWFDQALAASSMLSEALLNKAVVLTRIGRAGEALRILREGEPLLRAHPRYWTARGAAELAAQAPGAARLSYDSALRIDPGNARALQGRAQAALDQGAEDAIGWHERALAAVPGDRHVVRGLAEALSSAGRSNEALALTQALSTQVPDWVPGLEAHAAMRWAAGDREDFCDHFAAAALRHPSPALYQSWASTLAGVDRHEEAAAVAATGRRTWPADAALAMAELLAVGLAGDDAREGAILASDIAQTAAWRVHRARHLVRTGDPAAAEATLAVVVEEAPDDVSAWALLDVAWRLLDDRRHLWLSRQEGLVGEIALDLPPDGSNAVVALLDRLHDHAAMPIGQSVKDGSQTRGALLSRAEPAIAILDQALSDALRRYRDGLPRYDAAHPLLRHREAPWTIGKSWSIRLRGSGRHAAHIHPHGIVSSASYFLVPPGIDSAERPGWLELGRPPRDLRTRLDPIALVRPRPGHAVLFPSTLFHGTRPIADGTRMTVAFDVAAA